MHNPTVNIENLVDPIALLETGEYPYTFLAFRNSNVDANGIPVDPEAALYIARVQAAGVPVGVWLATPVEGIGFAFVAPADIKILREVLNNFEVLGIYDSAFAGELAERLSRR